jgi:hypothetical protein
MISIRRWAAALASSRAESRDEFDLPTPAPQLRGPLGLGRQVELVPREATDGGGG